MFIPTSILRQSSSEGSCGSVEISYNEFTSDVPITATSEAAADVVVTADSVLFDGSSVYVVEFFTPWVQILEQRCQFFLHDGSASIGELGRFGPSGLVSDTAISPIYLVRRFIPAGGSRAYGIRACNQFATTTTVRAGPGGNGEQMPGFIRITKETLV